MTVQMSTWEHLDSTVIAQRLRMYMGDKKISRAKLALASGISRTPLGAKLDGRNKFVFDELMSIAKALDKPWWWVITGEDAPPHPPVGADGPYGTDDAPRRGRGHRTGRGRLPRLDSNQEPIGLRHAKAAA